MEKTSAVFMATFIFLALPNSSEKNVARDVKNYYPLLSSYK